MEDVLAANGKVVWLFLLRAKSLCYSFHRHAESQQKHLAEKMPAK